MSKPYPGQPSAIVQQEFQAVPPGVIQTQPACIIGPEKRVFEATDSQDRIFINYGAYVPGADTDYTYSNLPVGGRVDQDSVTLIMEKALAQYATLSGADVIERGALANQINIPSALGFQAYDNGTTSYNRHANFKNRDVQIGDRVKVTLASDATKTVTTRITSFVNDVVPAVVGTPTATDNPATQAYSGGVVATNVAGTDHAVTINVATTTYAGDITKDVINDVYVLEVITAGAPATAKFKVTSTSGDNVAEVTSVAFGTAFDVGTRGLRAEVASAGSQAFVVGEKYTITVVAAYVQSAPSRTTAASVYDGLFDTVYKIEVVKGATWTNKPQVIVTTSTGIDAGGPIVVDFNTTFALGQLGVGVKFGNLLSCTTVNTDATVTTASTATLAPGMKVTGTGIPADATVLSITDGTTFELSANATASATNNLTFDLPQGGLVLGDIYYVTAAAAKKGAVRTAVLSNALDATISAGDNLIVDFYIYKESIEIPSKGYPQFSSLALTAGEDEFTVAAGIKILDSSWTESDGVTPGELPVVSATLIVPYTALLTANANVLRSISDLSSVSVILGKTIESNPLAYGVLKTLENSGGTPVYFISLQSDDLEGYQAALEPLEIDPTPYERVVLTKEQAVLDLLKGHIMSEASDETGNRCIGVIATGLDSIKVIYDKKADGDNWTGYVAVEPGSNPAIYTRVTAPGATFITDGIRPGFEYRTLFGVDAFGNPTYVAVKVDEVVDEENLILVDPGYSQAVGSSGSLQQFQIAQTLTKDEQAVVMAGLSEAFKTRRIYNVFADFPIECEHYFAACAVAGLASSVAPHQPITNYTITGFGDHKGTQKRFTPTQLNKMAEGGTLILTQARTGGDVYIRHQLSTDNTDDLQSEMSVCRNTDSISDYLLQGLKAFVGKYNITDNFLQMLDVQLRQRLNNLVANTATLTAGPQIVSWDESSLKITQNPVVRTEVDIEVDITQPMPANQLKLKLRVSA